MAHSCSCPTFKRRDQDDDDDDNDDAVDNHDDYEGDADEGDDDADDDDDDAAAAHDDNDLSLPIFLMVSTDCMRPPSSLTCIWGCLFGFQDYIFGI